MNKILQLLKLSWNLKLSIWRCYSFKKSTDEYRIAKYYQNSLNNLKDDTEEIKALILKTEQLNDKIHDKKEIINLLQNVISFLSHLEGIKS